MKEASKEPGTRGDSFCRTCAQVLQQQLLRHRLQRAVIDHGPDRCSSAPTRTTRSACFGTDDEKEKSEPEARSAWKHAPRLQGGMRRHGMRFVVAGVERKTFRLAGANPAMSPSA